MAETSPSSRERALRASAGFALGAQEPYATRTMSTSPVPSGSDRASLRGAAALVRSELGPLLGIALVLVPLGAGLSACLVGIPLLVYALGLLLRTLLRGAARMHGGTQPVESRWIGVLALAGLGLVVAVMVTAGAVTGELLAGAEASVQWGGGLVVAALAAVVLGAALGPCAFAPLLVAEGVAVSAALARSFEVAAALGPRRAARVGAVASAAIAVPLTVSAALFVEPEGDSEALVRLLVSLPFGLMVAPTLAGAWLTAVYVEARSRAVETSLDAAPARLLALRLTLVPSVALLLVALGAAALTPTSLGELPSRESNVRGWHGVGLERAPFTKPLPGGRAFARTFDRGVSIEAYDGGGAGRVSAGFETDVSALYFLPGPRPGTHRLVLTDGNEWGFTVVDEDGVRLDDGLGERVLGRLAGLDRGALGLGLALVLLLSARLGAELGRARTLAAPELRDGQVISSRLAALEGTLRLGDGSRLEVRGGRALVEGDAWVEAEGGALRFRIPPGRSVPWLGGAAPRAGAAILLVSRFGAVTRGLREAATPWPSDGRLALGRRVDATSALVERASRVASWTAVPAMLALTFAAVRLLAAL